MARPHLTSPLFLLAVTTSAVASGSVSVIDLSDELGTPPGLKTLRFVAQLDDPGARPLSVSADALTALEISTTDPLGFRNDAGRLSGTPADDFPNAPVGAAWDSWIALDSDLDDPNPLLLSPNFAGGRVPAVAGTSIVDANGGWYLIPDPAITWDLDALVLGQFTVGASFEVTFNGVLNWVSSAGEVHSLPITPCPDSSFETTAPCSRADLDGDGTIGFRDLITVLTHWGAAPTAWSFDRGTARVETTSAPDAPDACTIVRSIETDGFGTADATVAHDHLGVTVTADLTTGVTVSGADTVLAISGATTYNEDGVVGADATAVSSVEYEFDVLEPIACTLAFTFCSPTAATRLIGDNGFERVCTPYAGVLEPGHYTLRGTAFSDDAERTGGFGAILTLHDVRGADLDDDGVIGLGDVLTILSAWGPCGS